MCRRVRSLMKGAAAGGNDARAALEQPLDHPRFQRPELLFAIGVEQLGDRHARHALDLDDRYRRRECRADSRQPADRRLSGAHQTRRGQDCAVPSAARALSRQAFGTGSALVRSSAHSQFPVPKRYRQMQPEASRRRSINMSAISLRLTLGGYALQYIAGPYGWDARRVSECPPCFGSCVICAVIAGVDLWSNGGAGDSSSIRSRARRHDPHPIRTVNPPSPAR